jgi:hypothetical protein
MRTIVEDINVNMVDAGSSPASLVAAAIPAAAAAAAA